MYFTLVYFVRPLRVAVAPFLRPGQRILNHVVHEIELVGRDYVWGQDVHDIAERAEQHASVQEIFVQTRPQR